MEIYRIRDRVALWPILIFLKLFGWNPLIFYWTCKLNHPFPLPTRSIPLKMPSIQFNKDRASGWHRKVHHVRLFVFTTDTIGHREPIKLQSLPLCWTHPILVACAWHKIERHHPQSFHEFPMPLPGQELLCSLETNSSSSLGRNISSTLLPPGSFHFIPCDWLLSCISEGRLFSSFLAGQSPVASPAKFVPLSWISYLTNRSRRYYYI